MLSIRKIRGIFPGLAISVEVAAVALFIERMEVGLLGFAWVDGLVVAILLGTLVHTVFGLRRVFLPGIAFSARTVLEVAIVLIGASISTGAIAAAGWSMLAVVAAVVVAALAMSYAIGRALGLGDRLAMLVACGNSICGNSAIMAAAPVIDADSEEVAASIAFTAALGVLVVLLLPLGVRCFGLTDMRYGIIAGMTVYAVPQVLAATVPVSAVSTQVGTLVKLMRVLMLGPVVLMLGLLRGRPGKARARIGQMLPWFIFGFIGMAAARSIGFIPQTALVPLQHASSILTVISMAALGLSVDLRSVLASGGRVLAAGCLSILLLLALGILSLQVMPAG